MQMHHCLLQLLCIGVGTCDWLWSHNHADAVGHISNVERALTVSWSNQKTDLKIDFELQAYAKCTQPPKLSKGCLTLPVTGANSKTTPHLLLATKRTQLC